MCVNFSLHALYLDGAGTTVYTQIVHQLFTHVMQLILIN